MDAPGTDGTPRADAGPPRGPGRVLVVVSYVPDDSHYPRGGDGRRRRELYWSNIAVQAATLRHVAPAVEFVVATPDTPPEPAAGVLARAGARMLPVPFTHTPPPGFYARYAGSLYVLDTMAALEREVADDDVLLFVDPDLVWVRAPEPLVEEVRRGGVVGYDLQVPDWLSMCEVPRADQARIIGEVTGTDLDGDAPVHFGGELYGMRGAELSDVVAGLEPWWEATLDRFARGLDHFTVEEHLMNALLWQRGEQVGRANDHLQRIRTLPKPVGTRERADAPLVAWHLPYEKDRAFPRLLRRLAAGRPMPPVGPGYERWLRRRMGIDPVGARRVADLGRAVWWRLRPFDNPALPYGL